MKICNNGITRDMTPDEIAAWERSVAGVAPAATDAELAAATAEKAKAAAIAAKRAEIAAAQEYGTTLNGVRFSTSEAKMAFYRGVMDEAESLPPEAWPLPIIGEDGTLSAANLAELQGAYAALKAHFMAVGIIGGRELAALEEK